MRKIIFACFILNTIFLKAQLYVKGNINDNKSKEPLIGVVIKEINTNNGCVTDAEGNFILQISKLPGNIEIKYVGYITQTLIINDNSKKLKLYLDEDIKQTNTVEIIASRVTEKQKESPVTVETMNAKTISEVPASTFYESLGNLKGVDVTAASLGFRVVNTRGFNSTSPVRSLQIIDGVDNQSPGLNFSLGNFLGASDLDMANVDIIAGASSAYYGPNAFNGVIKMETKNPFQYRDNAIQVKFGERQMAEFSFRHVMVFKNKKGEDKLAYKINLFGIQALDWKAENFRPSAASDHNENNPGGYDAVNKYGDENFESNNSYEENLQKYESPGLGTFYRNGYKESELVDYTTKNFKVNAALHYKVKKDIELIYALNYGGGSTVYQGDNRYRLQGVKFLQNRIEYRKPNKYFIRAYSTNEDAGSSYDIVSTAYLLNNKVANDRTWNNVYKSNWNLLGFKNKVKSLDGYPEWSGNEPLDVFVVNTLDPFMSKQNDSLKRWHEQNKQFTDNFSYNRFNNGTERFDSVLSEITTAYLGKGGTRLYDKSALYHAQGEYIINSDFGDIILGGNARLYVPKTDGTIFNDGNGKKITNSEVGIYSGLEKRIYHNRFKLNATLRIDKNQNFKLIASPAVSIIYKKSKDETIRFSFSAAIRNPTLADQYLRYNVGRATLLGNLNGFDSLITIPSFRKYTDSLNTDRLVYFNLAPIRQEKVKTLELNYKKTFAKNWYLDAGYYFSFYTDFIGYTIGINARFKNNLPEYLNIYRVASNSNSLITTQGLSIGLNHFFKKYAIVANYSWNKLNKKNTDDPIVPAFNTPEHKFNIGINGRKITLFDVKDFGFSVNYKWIQGFTFEGSPQFTGSIPAYDMVDFQINKEWEKIKTIAKLGCSNSFGILPLLDSNIHNYRSMFNNRNYQVYGGPLVGRMLYISVLKEF